MTTLIVVLSPTISSTVVYPTYEKTNVASEGTSLSVYPPSISVTVPEEVPLIKILTPGKVSFPSDEVTFPVTVFWANAVPIVRKRIPIQIKCTFLNNCRSMVLNLDGL